MIWDRCTMSVMEWNEQMSVGLAELDDDHKQLIRVINQLGANSGDESRRAAVRQSLVALRRYAEFHFAREEKVLGACGYPNLEDHQAEHRAFVQHIGEMNRQFDENPERMADIVNEELLTYLRDWLNHHILIEDKAYRPFVEASPKARAAAKTFKATEIWWNN